MDGNPQKFIFHQAFNHI